LLAITHRLRPRRIVRPLPEHALSLQRMRLPTWL
jgi:hypothetical protein